MCVDLQFAVLNLVWSFVQQSKAFIDREVVRLTAISATTSPPLDPTDVERLQLYTDSTMPLSKKMASLAEDNANYRLWHSALLVDAMPLLAFRQSGEIAIETGWRDGECLDRAAMKELAPLFPTVTIAQILTVLYHLCLLLFCVPQ